MRKFAFALLLLAATSVAAQVVSTIEQSYGPYERPPTDASLGFAASRNRILLAWSEVAQARSRVRVGLLDFDGRLVSPIETISAEASDYSFAPVAASDGSAFAVLYAELTAPFRLFRVEVDAAGHRIGAPHSFYAAREPARNVTLFWNGASYVAYVDGIPSEFRADGAGVPTYFTPIDPGGAILRANGTLAIAWWNRTRPCLFCALAYNELVWYSGKLFGTYRPRQLPLVRSGIAVSPVVGSYGTETVIAWVNDGINYYVIDSRPREVLMPVNADPAQQLSIACDPKLCLLAYATTTGDIQALAMEIGREDTPRVLQIATSGRREWHPQAVKVADGRFLVAYYSDLPGDTRFAGRIVSMPPSRTRSVGK
jgi:hypothetical protein